MNARNFALILVRCLGMFFVALGAQGLLGVILAPLLRASAWAVLPGALRDNFDYLFAADLWGTPFYLLAGIILLLASKHLARAICHGIEP